MVDPFNLFDCFITGHYGTGKTVVGVESVKIKKAKYEDEGIVVEVHVMPQTKHPVLRERLENRWFSDLEDVKYHDSLEDFANICTGSKKGEAYVGKYAC
jgi:hypothetical protein